MSFFFFWQITLVHPTLLAAASLLLSYLHSRGACCTVGMYAALIPGAIGVGVGYGSVTVGCVRNGWGRWGDGAYSSRSLRGARFNVWYRSTGSACLVFDFDFYCFDFFYVSCIGNSCS